MEAAKVLESLKTNLLLECPIKDIQGFVKFGNPDKITGIALTMDDPVKTQLYIYVEAGELKIELSHLEKVVTEVRKTYMDNIVPF